MRRCSDLADRRGPRRRAWRCRARRAPPIRAIPIGRAIRSRCRKSRSPRCGRVRRSTTSSTAWENDPAIKDLVARLAARRTPLDDAREDDRGVPSPAAAAERQQKAKLLFAGLFETLNRERSEVMNGIERFSRKQKEFADQIRADDSRAARAPGHARSRSEQGRRTGQPRRVGDAHFRGAAQDHRLCLRGSRPHRAAPVCARAGDPAIARVRPHSRGRGAGLASLERKSGVLPAVGAVGVPGDAGIAQRDARASPRSTTSSNRAGSRSPAALARSPPVTRSRPALEVGLACPPRVRRSRCRGARCCRECCAAASPARAFPAGRSAGRGDLRHHVDEDRGSGSPQRLRLGGRDHARAPQGRGRRGAIVLGAILLGLDRRFAFATRGHAGERQRPAAQ